jgi:hypothetical protein
MLRHLPAITLNEIIIFLVFTYRSNSPGIKLPLSGTGVWGRGTGWRDHWFPKSESADIIKKSSSITIFYNVSFLLYVMML